MAPGKQTLTMALDAEARQPVNRGNSGGSGAALPGALQRKMDAAFNFDFSQVRVHEGQQAPAMGATAYTEGTDLHFAPGEYQPGSPHGQELIGHELSHVVQQSEGRVQATKQFKGVGLNDDAGLEAEADLWGAIAARGEPVARSPGVTSPGTSGSVQRKVIQRAPQPSHYGRFTDTEYRVDTSAQNVVMHLTFEPNAEVDATKIGLTQSTRTEIAGSPVVVDAQTAPRQVASGPGAGYEIDRIPDRNNPVYGSASLPAGRGLAATAPTNAPPGTARPSPANATYELGHHYTDASGPHTKNAWLHDTPSMEPTNNIGVLFETTAVGLEGAQQGTYYGSVKWGLRRNATGTLSAEPFQSVSQGAPSQNFLAAADAWNRATTGGTLEARNAPTQIHSRTGGGLTPAFTITQHTVVESSRLIGVNGITYHFCRVQGGPQNGRTGYILATALRDRGDGGATIDLPVPGVHTLNAPQTLNHGVTGSLRYRTALPAATRVAPASGGAGNAPPTKVWVRVVDGPSTGEVGWIDRTAMTDERP